MAGTIRGWDSKRVTRGMAGWKEDKKKNVNIYERVEGLWQGRGDGMKDKRSGGKQKEL